MLDKLIEMQYRNFGNDRDKLYENKEIATLESQLSEFTKEIRDMDKDLSNKLDILIGDIESTYSNVYFKEGFKQGLILDQEIQQLLLIQKR